VNEDARGPDLRASDGDRERAVAALKEHCAAGRLTLEELPERVARAYGARTLGDLADVMRDLPEPRVSHGVPAPQRRPMMPGMAAFTETLEIPRPPEEVLTETLRQVAPRLAYCGYELVDHGGERLDFELTDRPAWVIALGIVTFPLGLLLILLYKRRTRVSLSVEELVPGRSLLVVRGLAPLVIRRAFAELRR
jgi:Domain of unknown function (DUF1707)